MKTPKKKKPKAPESFQDLKATWYAKLEKSGFEDAERDEYTLRFSSSKFNTDETARNYYAKLEYYTMAGKFLHDHKFVSNLEKVIWEYHVNGISARNIAKLLKKVKIIKPNKDNVSQIIARLVKEMKKIYLVGYLN